MSQRPPELAERLAARLLPEGVSREGALGDLCEELQARAARDGVRRARLWYWAQVAGLARHRVGERLREGPPRRPRRRRGGIMSSVTSDLRQGVRALRRSPGFSAVAVATLALGIGANVAIFSVVRAVLLRPLPYPEPERLVVVWENDRLRGTEREGVSLPDYEDFLELNRSFESMAARLRGNRTLAADAGAVRLDSSSVTASYFSMLGVQPLLGRTFDLEDERPGSAVVVLGEGLWRSHFGADPGVLGRRVQLDGEPRSVVGVVPEAARLPFSTEQIFEPLVEDPRLDFRGRHSLLALGRLAPGVSLEQAQEDMASLMRHLEEVWPDDNTGRGAVLVPFHEQLVGDVRPALLVLLAAVVAVLLVACANVANLLLARGLTRSRDLAVRTALGAGPWRLARLVLVEGFLLALLGGAAGTGVAYAGVRLLVAAGPADLPRLETIRVDGLALTFALLLSLATGFVFALLPAARSAFARPVDALREGGRVTAGGTARRLLVVAEVALSVALVVSAGLLIRSFHRLQQVEPGFRPEGLLLASFQLAGPGYAFPDGWPVHEWPALDAFVAELQPRLEALPGVTSVALAHMGPVDPGWTTRVTVVGRPAPPPGEQDEASFRPVSAAYFETAGTPILAGRGFSGYDTSDAALVAVVNEAFVRRHFPGEEPIGKSIVVFGDPREVVGVARDVRFAGLERDADPAMYLPLEQNPMGGLVLLVRCSGDPGLLANPVREQVAAVAPALALFDVGTAEAALEGRLGERRFATGLLLLFAAVALCLALVGVYGVVAYTVAQRTRELGVRLALGAAPADLLRMVVGQALGLAGAAVALGFGLALASGRLLKGLLFGVDPGDPATLVVVAALLAAAAVGASLVPARRAMRVDPLEALRSE